MSARRNNVNETIPKASSFIFASATEYLQHFLFESKTKGSVIFESKTEKL